MVTHANVSKNKVVKQGDIAPPMATPEQSSYPENNGAYVRSCGMEGNRRSNPKAKWVRNHPVGPEPESLLDAYD